MTSARRAALLVTSPMDAEACYRAVQVRDARFAGRFFLAVRTTRIYCRPGCPARLPRRENVEFYPSAAAAEGHGYRACLRCRPDAAPGSPAQAGTAATLSRALRLLEETADASGLASRLGMTDRHLRRLFAKQLGATPAAVLRTRRLHLARQLLESSTLPITEVALSAGFKSLRRFNDAVLRGFGKPPRELRKAAHGSAELTLKLPFHAPLDFEALLHFLGARTLQGLEEVTPDGAWRRRLPEGWLEVRRGGSEHLLARIPAAASKQLLQLVARIQRVFDLRADPAAIRQHLSVDSLLPLRPGLRVPGAWEPFEMAVRAILGQQITVQHARALAQGLLTPEGFFPSPAELASREIRGMPGARARAITALAVAVRDGAVRLDGSQPCEDVIASLCALPGIGDWTAQLIALRALGEPDAFPAADLGLLKASGLSEGALRARAEAWRPWRAYAAAALWLGGQP